uniref:PsbP C-terminal domain-containing protein n=1 Tax=Manihot esculenta TaxID=3983 RepID=A0A2C9UWR1_MANES
MKYVTCTVILTSKTTQACGRQPSQLIFSRIVGFLSLTTLVPKQFNFFLYQWLGRLASPSRLKLPTIKATAQYPVSPKPYFQFHCPKASLFTGNDDPRPLSFCSSKRKLNLAILALIITESLPNTSKTILAVELEQLQRYTDPKEGFTLLVPSSYAKVDKAGATVLFEEINKASNNVGVVVTSLGEFGTPQFVADKLIQAEKRKCNFASGCGIVDS